MTKFLIITSTEDKASMNMRNILLSDTLLKFRELETKWQDNPLIQLEFVLAKTDYGPFFHENEIYIGLTDSPLIQLDKLKLEGSGIDPDFIIFASRHRSEKARLAFLTHTTGNWNDKAEYGGNPHEISKTSAVLLRAAYLTLTEQKYIKERHSDDTAEYVVDIEVTHHGPTTVEKPLIFMELGSSENEWENEKAGLVVAHSLFSVCFKYEKLKGLSPHIGIGFGGTHYAPQFKRLMDLKNVAMSFICPKYYIQDLDKKLIESMIHNTYEKIDSFIIDWKGTNSADKQHLMPLLEEFEIPINKTKDF